MEPAPRTEPLDHADIAPVGPPPTEARSGGLLGLPGRLALLTVCAVLVSVAGIAAYADHRLQVSAHDRAVADTTSAARAAASGFSESDFADDAAVTRTLRDRLAQLREADPDIASIALYAKAPGATRIADRSASPASSAGRFSSLARRAITSGEETSTVVGGDRVRVAWPVTFSDGQPGAVLAIERSAGSTFTDARQGRLRLLLGSLVGGSLLGIVILVLLRRELFRPLEELRRAMTQIRGGARGVRIGWSRGDELGAVADDFDAMVAQLEATQDELSRYVNKDPLTGLLTREAFTDRFSGELTRARREGYPISLLAIDVDDLAGLNRTHDQAAGDQVLAALGEVIGGCTRPTDACGRTGGDSFHVALVGADASQAAVVISRIRAEVAQRVGIGPERTRVTCGFGVAEYPTHAVDQIALERMAEAACGHAQRGGRDRALAFGPAGGYVDALSLAPSDAGADDGPTGERELASTVHALARALDGIDPVLGGGAHSNRVARYAVALGRELDMSDGQLRELRSAATLHDIGKVAVPPSILRMPAAELDERQRGALRYHAWVARTMIAGAGLASVADIVFHMPENWDGTGYPEKAREDAIPLASRILRAAELLDDLTSGDAGRQAHTPFDAATALRGMAGAELDPDIATRLVRLVREDGLLGPETTTAPAAEEAPAADAA
ncbi:MAG: diguanylate cyclase protein/HDIG protein [Thermoleophilia bacterium]|nr:diguanylate cyclase protein/HDIG protein [Thermoleophilia bacterium]